MVEVFIVIPIVESTPLCHFLDHIGYGSFLGLGLLEMVVASTGCVLGDLRAGTLIVVHESRRPDVVVARLRPLVERVGVL